MKQDIVNPNMSYNRKSVIQDLGNPSNKKNPEISENCQIMGGRGPVKPKLQKIG